MRFGQNSIQNDYYMHINYILTWILLDKQFSCVWDLPMIWVRQIHGRLAVTKFRKLMMGFQCDSVIVFVVAADDDGTPWMCAVAAACPRLLPRRQLRLNFGNSNQPENLNECDDLRHLLETRNVVQRWFSGIVFYKNNPNQ